MAFKKSTGRLGFMDLDIANCLEQNRSVKLLEQFNNVNN
jgi:hypothetical protein